jgi:hypothetical protein
MFRTALGQTVKQPAPPAITLPRVRSPPSSPRTPPAPVPDPALAPSTAVSKHPYSSIAWAELKKLKDLANKVVCQDDAEQMEGYNAEVKRFRRWFTPYKGKEACFVFKIYPKRFIAYLRGEMVSGRKQQPKKMSKAYSRHQFNRRMQRKWRADGKRREENRFRETFLTTFGSLVQHSSPAIRHQARKFLNDFPFAAVAMFRSIEAAGFDGQSMQAPEPGEIPFFTKGTCVIKPPTEKLYVPRRRDSSSLVVDVDVLHDCSKGESLTVFVFKYLGSLPHK